MVGFVRRTGGMHAEGCFVLGISSLARGWFAKGGAGEGGERDWEREYLGSTGLEGGENRRVWTRCYGPFFPLFLGGREG